MGFCLPVFLPRASPPAVPGPVDSVLECSQAESGQWCHISAQEVELKDGKTLSFLSKFLGITDYFLKELFFGLLNKLLIRSMVES